MGSGRRLGGGVSRRHGRCDLTRGAPVTQTAGPYRNPGSGGLVNETRDGSEDEVWSLGPDLWGSHRNDHRLCVGWLDNLRNHPNDDQRGGLGESGGDLRRPIYEATEP